MSAAYCYIIFGHQRGYVVDDVYVRACPCGISSGQLHFPLVRHQCHQIAELSRLRLPCLTHHFSTACFSLSDSGGNNGVGNEHLCPMRRHKRLKYMQAVRSSSQRIRRSKSWYQMHEVGRSCRQWIKQNWISRVACMCIGAVLCVQACMCE